MDYDEFIRCVAERAQVPEDQAVALTSATMMTLAERITGGEVRDLAAVLPPEVAPPVVPPEDVAEKFDLEEFVRRVHERARVSERLARWGVRMVFMTLQEAVPGKEFQDVLDQLPKEFGDI